MHYSILSLCLAQYDYLLQYNLDNGCRAYRRGVLPEGDQLCPRGAPVCALRRQLEHRPVRLVQAITLDCLFWINYFELCIIIIITFI